MIQNYKNIEQSRSLQKPVSNQAKRNDKSHKRTINKNQKNSDEWIKERFKKISDKNSGKHQKLKEKVTIKVKTNLEGTQK